MGREDIVERLQRRLVGGRYRMLRHAGQNRLGEIYEAVDTGGIEFGVERPVLLQLVDSRLTADPRRTEVLLRGLAALRAGPHPNIQRVLDCGRDGTSLYVVYEMPDGLTLRAVLDGEAPNPVSLAEAKAVVRQVGDALRFLHGKGIIHRNLRPEHVFIRFDYVVVLLDVAPVNLPLSVPGFPEDLDTAPARSVDPRDDVYGLACLAYEMLSGRHPFNANSALEAWRAGRSPAVLGGEGASAWPALQRALALRRNDRTPAIDQFMAEFGITGTEAVPAGDRGAPVPARSAEPSIIPARRVAAATATRRPAASRPSAARAPLELMLLACMVAASAYHYETLRSLASDLMAAAPQLSRQSVAPSGPATGAAAIDRIAGPGLAGTPPNPVVAASDTSLPATTSAAGDQAAAAIPNASPAEADGFSFERTSLSVRENQAAVPIVIRRTGSVSHEARVIWWCEPGTAIAGTDYADLGSRSERFAAGESSHTVYVPIVDDSLPEATKYFTVHLGQPDGETSRLKPLAEARIEIVDDDG